MSEPRIQPAHIAAQLAVLIDHQLKRVDGWGPGRPSSRVAEATWSGGTVRIVLANGQTFIAAISDASGMFGRDVLERARQSAAAAGIEVEKQLTDQDKADRIGERLFPGVSFP